MWHVECVLYSGLFLAKPPICVWLEIWEGERTSVHKFYGCDFCFHSDKSRITSSQRCRGLSVSQPKS